MMNIQIKILVVILIIVVICTCLILHHYNHKHHNNHRHHHCEKRKIARYVDRTLNINLPEITLPDDNYLNTFGVTIGPTMFPMTSNTLQVNPNSWRVVSARSLSAPQSQSFPTPYNLLPYNANTSPNFAGPGTFDGINQITLIGANTYAGINFHSRLNFDIPNQQYTIESFTTPPNALIAPLEASLAIQFQYNATDINGLDINVGSINWYDGPTSTPLIPPMLNGRCMNGSLGEIDFRRWTSEIFLNSIVANDPVWTPSTDGRNVVQSGTQSGGFGVLYSDFDFGHCQIAEIPVKATLGTVLDDDFIGFVLGFTPGDGDGTNPQSDYLLIDWKQLDEGSALMGLNLWRINGTPTFNEIFDQKDPPLVTNIAQGITLGNIGWVLDQPYTFHIEYSSKHLKLWVDDVLQFDEVGDFPEGRLGLYNCSQTSEYGNFSGGSIPIVGNGYDLCCYVTDGVVLGNNPINPSSVVITRVEELSENVINELSLIDFTGWTADQYPDIILSDAWVISPGGYTATETRGLPGATPHTILSGSDLDLCDWIVQIDASAPINDLFGFVIGYNPGDAFNPNANFIDFGWGDKTYFRHVTGAVPGPNVSSMGMTNFVSDEIPYIKQLGTGINFGSTMWTPGVTYTFRFEYVGEVFRMFIDNDLEFEIPWIFVNGANVGLSAFSCPTPSWTNGFKWTNVNCPCIEMIPDSEWVPADGNVISTSIDVSGVLTVTTTNLEKAVRVGVTIDDTVGQTTNEALNYFGFKCTRYLNFIETLIVSSRNPSPTLTSFTSNSDKRYAFVATGLIQFNFPGNPLRRLDAKFTTNTYPTGWFGPTSPSGHLLIDGAATWQTESTVNLDHRYLDVRQGTGAQFGLNQTDSDYIDNAGSYTVDVYEIC